jgi:GNAT superfamily N-acetyltransferase
MKKLEIVTISQDSETRRQQIDRICEIEEQAWPDGTKANRRKFEERARLFPEGFFLGLVEGKIVGMVTCLRFDYAPGQPIDSWEWVTGNGYLTQGVSGDGRQYGHNPAGNAIYGVSLAIDPSYRGQGFGRQLFDQIYGLAYRLGLGCAVIGARMPGYADAKQASPALTAEEHAPFDWEVRMYQEQGYIIVQVQANYMEDDPESLNYGVIMIRENPDAQERREQ